MLLCIPAGDFWMGSSESTPKAQDDEKPQRRIYLDAYWIDRTEVTNAMFTKCVESGYCHKRDRSPYIFGIYTSNWDLYYANPTYANFPVIMLSADEAGLYCQWAGRRQPSEAEWEKAARGTDGRTYPWGESIDCQRANYFECEGDTTDVNSHPSGASPYGVLNLAGNLWEWVADWYAVDTYASMPARNPTGPAAGKYHVLRGGAWGSLTPGLRAANRAMGEPEHYYDNQMGIRCAADVSNR